MTDLFIKFEKKKNLLDNEYSNTIKYFIQSTLTKEENCSCKICDWINQSEVLLLLNKQHLLIEVRIYHYYVNLRKFTRK